jgi:hypothetical protein
MFSAEDRGAVDKVVKVAGVEAMAAMVTRTPMEEMGAMGKALLSSILSLSNSSLSCVLEGQAEMVAELGKVVEEAKVVPEQVS